MTACSRSWGIPQAFYSYRPALIKTNIEPELLDRLTSSLVTTECVNSVKTSLTEEIDSIYEDCKQDGWVNNKKEKSLGVNYDSTLQAKEFASYIEDMAQPYVVPFANGCIGFEWNINNKLISIMFKAEGSYIYSIVTDTMNEYGENKQTIENQQNLLQRISQVLAEGIL